ALSVLVGTSIGVSYDSSDNTLPSPNTLLKLLKEHHVFQLILSDANPNVLETLSGSGIEVSVGMSYKETQDIGNSKSRAALWVKKNVMRFRSVTSIDVGHESMMEEESIISLVSAMKAIHSALYDVKLEDRIKLTTTLSSTPPPLQDADLRHILQPLVHFLSQTGSILLFNMTFHQTEDVINSVVAAANNVMAFLQYPTIPIALHVLCPASSVADKFLIAKNLRTQIPNLDLYSEKLSAVLVKMNSFNSSKQKELGRLEQLPPSFRQLLDKKANSTRNESVSHIDSSLIGETTPPPPITTPIITPTTPLTPPITTPSTTPITTPTQTSGSWCIAKSGVSDTSLQVALDYACGLGGADCGAIQQGGTCYNPDTVAAHASYAFDNYYKKNGMTSASCDFGGNAVVTNQDPSSGTCTYSTG
ncbi:hypothetical protein KI387_005874, partial [Taxus chinensis]